ncbi:hypothetical protein NPIL_74421 [Nephila pilipes]|uniref:Uncharacterized protein n=1 Tax=Nephila pilipes TaxID=299642 RepID=A0A8X6PQN9_NEPPI|nr:hypothetical protein NPIL_74421 [Nephila pilipes]
MRGEFSVGGSARVLHKRLPFAGRTGIIAMEKQRLRSSSYLFQQNRFPTTAFSFHRDDVPFPNGREVEASPHPAPAVQSAPIKNSRRIKQIGHRTTYTRLPDFFPRFDELPQITDAFWRGKGEKTSFSFFSSTVVLPASQNFLIPKSRRSKMEKKEEKLEREERKKWVVERERDGAGGKGEIAPSAMRETAVSETDGGR